MHASAFRRTSFDHITCASESARRCRRHVGRRRAALRRARCIGAAAPGSSARHLDEQERARVHDDAGLGRSASTRIEPASTRLGREALAQHGDVVEAVEQRQHERRLRRAIRSSAASSPAAFVATISASTGSSQPRDRARARDELAELDALDAHAALGDRPRPSTRARRPSRPSPARASAPASRPPTPPGPRIGHPRCGAAVAGLASISTPGFMIACGSSAAFAPRERGGERLGALPVIPRPVVAPDRVVVGDRAAGGDQRVGDGALDVRPLLDLLAAARRRDRR